MKLFLLWVQETRRSWTITGRGLGWHVGQCGWCKDRFGVHWQIIPENMAALQMRPEQIQAMMGMKKIDIAALEAAGKTQGNNWTCQQVLLLERTDLASRWAAGAPYKKVQNFG